ncbi:MAG: flagellar basal-body rod protein FlgF [Alphaproteobacteria bacterium]|jgi:flagellar basal-body rod protein FlgF
MENALLIALSRQTVMEKHMQVVANNIANASTPGYKGEQMLFAEYLADNGNGETTSFVQDIAVVRDYGEGEMIRSGNSLDFAIHGKGWFVVDTPEGPAYTRNGHFSLDAQGQLTTTNGSPVLSATGTPIIFGAEDSGIVVSGDGTITTETGEKGRLAVVTFEDEREMKKSGDSQYVTDQPTTDAKDIKIIQGMLESSNVQPIIEITNMIAAMRSYQSAQQTVVEDSGLIEKAIDVLTNQQA